MFNLISKKERKFIDDYTCLYTSQDIDNRMIFSADLRPFEERFFEWNRQKSNFLFPCIFKNKLTYEKEIEIDMPVEEKFERSEIVNHDFLSKFRNYIYTHKDSLRYNSKQVDFLMKIIHSFLGKDSLIENIYRDEDIYLNLPQEKVFVIRKGCKTIKTLGKLASAFGLEKEFEDFRLKHSLINNEKKISGTLCISIHLIDFLTLSDNDYDWSSCYSIRDYGAYRCSTVETMNSPHVIVAYLKGKNKPTSYNKKWRELFIVSPWALIGVKGYPYHNKKLEKIAMDFISEVAESNGFSYSKGTLYTPDIEKHFRLEFNDLYSRDFDCFEDYPIRYAKNYSPFDSDGVEKSFYMQYILPSIVVGGKNTCLVCGRPYEHYTITGNNDSGDEMCLLCPDCDNIIECEECGDYLFNREGDYVYNEKTDTYICEDCFNMNYLICYKCGDIIDMRNGVYEVDQTTGDILCENCIEEKEEEYII